ncbi:leukocyte receptor cluster member 1 homolog [Drosophila mojavensis]|nr:leukocyte receptor cluster member 1 homolog [Drosophila mojavensis]
MNILPKKRWHVRTKDNIARVRRDEAAAQEIENKRLDKLKLAESEARINYLRRQSGLPENVRKGSTNEESGEIPLEGTTTQTSTVTSAVDLFADYKSHVKKTNKDLEKEKKEEQEKYEKQIGYLTYLGQDTNEALKVRSWYELAPNRAENHTEIQLKAKLSQDPLTLINALVPKEKPPPVQAVTKRRNRSPTPTLSVVASERSPESKRQRENEKDRKKKKHDKKHKKRKRKRSKSEKSNEAAEDAKRDKLNRLRKERLLREERERQRQEQLFAPKETAIPAKAAITPAPTPRIVQKYNSQFNPEFAKQNMI